MAENNELSIVLGAELDMGSIRSQLAEISKSKDNKIVVQADTSEAKNTIKELKDELKNSKSPAKITIDVLKGQSNTNIGNYIKEIQDKYQASPIKITLDVDKNATTANINKAVGEMQQQVQKAVDQAAKSVENTVASISSGRIVSANTDITSVSVDKYVEELNNAIERYQSVFTDKNLNLSGYQVIHNELDDSYRAAVQFSNALGEVTNVMFRLKTETDEDGEEFREWVTSGQKFSASFKDAGKDIENTLDVVQKRMNELQSRYSEVFDKNAARTLFFEPGDTKNQDFAQPVIDQYNKIKNTLEEIKTKAENSGIPATKEQVRELSEEFSKLNDVIKVQKNARWTATNFKETDTTSFVERYKNMMVELSNALKDDGVYDKFQTKISELFTTLNSVKSGDASTGDFLNQLRNIKQEINTFESSSQGKGIMAAFDISEDQLTRIRSLGDALKGQENTQGIDILRQRLSGLKMDYEDLQDKMRSGDLSADMLKGFEIERSALDKELQSINSIVNNLGNESWVNSQNAGIADMKAKFAEYREEITKTVQLTPELDDRLKALAQAMNESGKVDVTNWKDYNNEIKTLKANIEEFKNSLQGKASQLSLGIEANQLDQINEVVNKLNSLDEQYTGGGVERIKSDFQSLSEEYQKIINQLQSKDLTDSQFKELSKQAEELDQKLKQLTKEAATFGNQDSFGKFTASTNTLKLNLERLEKQYAALIAKNPELAGKVEDLKQRLESLRPGEIPTITKDIGNLGKEMANASGQTAGLRGALTDAFGGLGSYLARFTSSYYIITKTIQGIKKMVTAVKEVDTSLVELQKVTNLTGDSLAQFTDKAYQMGAQLGRTGKDVIDAATTFSRAGYDLNEATQLAQSALVMTNVGVDIPNMESAASDMISILKAFDIQAEESMGVIDKLYNVANKEPLDFGNITQMLVTAGGTLAQTGTSIEQTMGLLTGAFATMRDESVSNGLIMISQRLRGLSEDGEAIDGLVPKLKELFSSVGINIEDQNGQLRSTFQILNDLAGVWDQLSSKQRQYFGEKVAGNRQVKTLNAIMQNWDVVADTIDKANNAQGEALKGNEMYMDSIEGRMTQLQSAFQELARTTIDSDLIKNITSAGTEVIKFATSAGGLVPILTTIIGLIVTIKGAKIAEGLGKIWTAFSTLFTGMSSGLSLATGWVGILIAVAGAVAMFVAHTNEANSALKKFEEAKESYEEHKNKVESLNDELGTTQDRIEELEAKEHLTIIEQKELDRLKEVNTQLQTQIALEEKLAEIAQGQARDAATKIIEEENSRKAVTSVTGDQIRKEISKNLTDDIIQDIVADSWKTMPLFSDELSYAPTNEEQVRLRIEAIKQDYAELVKIQEQIANLKPGHAAMKDELDAESDAIAENIKNNKEALSDYYNWLENKTEGIDYVKDAKPGSQEARYNELLDFKKAIGDVLLYEDVFNPPINDEAFNEVLSRYPEAIKEIQDQLKETSSDGWELDIPEDLAQELMSKFDLTMDEVKQLFEEKYGEGSDGLQLTIGPQMSIDADETIKNSFQNKDGYQVLTKALSEQEKAGELTAATLQKLLSSEGLPGIAGALDKTANGYKLNTDRVNEYVKALNEETRINAVAGIMERQLAIENLLSANRTLTESEYAQVATWENEIIMLQALANEAYGATDALDALREASKTPDEDADYTEGQGLLKKTQEKIDEGKLGTDDFRAGMDYLLGKDWYERFNGDLDKAIATFEAKRKKFFADDDADSANNFMNALGNLKIDGQKVAEYDKVTGKIKMLKNEVTGADFTLEEVANALGISEDAARDLFELLNAYSFEDKFQFGDDVLDSADKIAVAEKKLQEIDEQRTQKKKELKEAEEEYNKITDAEEQKKKAAEIDELNKQIQDLDTQYNNLATSIETANKAMEDGTKPPETLEEALKQIQDYQQAITTLEENGITPTVELQGDVDTLTALLSDPTTTLTVNATPGTIDSKIGELESLRKAIDENPNISATVKATVDGITDSTIRGLQDFNQEVKTIDGKKYVSSKITISSSGGDQATVVIQNVKKDADELNDSDPTVDIKAEKDKSVDEVKDDLKKLPSPDELTAMYMAEEDSKSLKTVSDLLDKIAKDREVKYKAKFEKGTQKTNEELWAGWKPKRPRITEKDWEEWNNDFNEAAGRPFDNEQIEFTPKVNETELGKEFREALQSAEENAEPVKITPKMTEEAWEQWEKELDEAADHPFDIETSVDGEEIAGQVQDGIEQGAENADPKVNMDTSQIENDVTDAIEGMPPAEAPVDVDSNTLIGKIKNLIKNTKLGDLVVNVKQKVEKAKTAAPKDVTQTVNVKGKDAGGTKAVQDVQKEAEKGATVPVDADTKEAMAEDKSLVNKIKEKVLKPVGLALGDINKQISELEKRLSQEVQKKIKITYEETNQRPYAKGTKKAEEGISLVDEKGAELIEHTKRGTFELGTNDGARLTHLDEGDVVHTAEETKKILSRLADAGGFFRNGLNKAKSLIGNAFATGVSGKATVKPKKKKDDKDKKTSTKTGSGSRSSSSSSSSDSGSNDEMSRWTEWAKQFFDWAEIKLKRLKETTKSYTEEAARAIGVWAKNKEIKKAMKSVRTEISATQKAYIEYMNTAAEIASRSGLSADIIKKIQNGTIDVTKYDDVVQQKIKDYQEWYEKALACKDAIEQLKDQEKELAKQRLQNIVDDYTARARIYESDASVGTAQREYDEAIGKATKGTSIADRYLDSSGNILLDESTYETSTNALEDALYTDIDLIDAFVDDYIDAFNELENFNLDLPATLTEGVLLDGGLSPDTIWRKTEQEYGSFSDEIHSAEAKKEELEQARRNIQREFDAQVSQGLVKVGDDTWLEYTNKLKELDKDILQTGANIERLKDQANDAAFIPFRNQMGDFTYEAGKATQEMELGNVRGSLGRSGKKDTYEKLIDNAESQNKNLKIQNELYKQLQEGLDVNSQKYQELEQKIRDNETAMLANEEAVEKYKQAIKQLGLDSLSDDFNDLTNESSRLNDELSMKMLKGIEITEGAYEQLIQNGREQINNLVNQRNAYQALMDELVAMYGEEAKSSDLYRQYKAQVDSLDQSIRGLDQSVVQWSKDMKGLNAEKLGWQLDSLKNRADVLSDRVDTKKATGKTVTADDYRIQMANAQAEKNTLLQQNLEYARQQEGMDFNSQEYQDLQRKIDDNEKAMRSLDAATIQWQKDIQNIPAEKLGWDLDALIDSSEKLSDSLSLKELKGIEVKDADYNNLINNASARKSTLLRQNAEFISQQKGMDKYSEEYQKLAEKIRANEKEMRQLDEATIKWKKDMNALKVQKLVWQLDDLNASIDRINNRKSLNEIQGYDIAADVYKNLIENSMRRIELLKQENQLLQNQQSGMDKNSEAYQELQKQIVANNNEIDSIKISQEEWNDNIVDIGIKNLQKYRESLSKSNDQLQRQKELQQAIQDLEKADSQRKVRTYVEGQGFVYQRDEEEFRKAQENLENVVKDQLLDKIDDLIDALEESKNDTNVYDKNGNLLGSVYNTPQLGNLADLLTKYYASNSNATLDIDLLKSALGKNIISNISPQNNSTSFSIGDITINEVKNGNELAQAIVDQFPNALLQAMYSKQ